MENDIVFLLVHRVCIGKLRNDVLLKIKCGIILMMLAIVYGMITQDIISWLIKDLIALSIDLEVVQRVITQHVILGFTIFTRIHDETLHVFIDNFNPLSVFMEILAIIVPLSIIIIAAILTPAHFMSSHIGSMMMVVRIFSIRVVVIVVSQLVEHRDLTIELHG